MPKSRPSVTDDEHVLAALHAAKKEGAKAVLVEIGGANRITSIRVFLDDEYRRLLSDEETVAYEFKEGSFRSKGRD